MLSRPGAAEELYDLKRDPDQMHNLATDAVMGTVKSELSAKLMAILEKTSDPRLADAFDKPPYVGPATASSEASTPAKPRKKKP